MMAGNREFVRKHPVATKRALRAILKADQICALEPEKAARLSSTRALRRITTMPSRRSRRSPTASGASYDPEDTVRFYSLRLHEVGHDQVEPAKIIAQGTDWRFLRELKKELKA